MDIEKIKEQIKRENADLFPDEAASYRRKRGKLLDFLTIQCIICILMVLAFLLINMVRPVWAKSVTDTVNTQTQNVEPTTENIINYANSIYHSAVGKVTDAIGGDTENAEILDDEVVLPCMISAPLTGLITSHFGERENPFGGEKQTHYGVDVAADSGTDIRACADGVIITSDSNELAGKYVEIEHTGGLISRYLHCSELFVDEGDEISAGDIIASVGNTGNSTGPHLHFELKLNGVAVNPEKVVDISD